MIETLPQLISLAESNNAPGAMRYEPAFRVPPAYITRTAKAVGCSRPTADMICRTSWGRFQIMGVNLLDLGLAEWPHDFMLSEQKQLNAFLAFIEWRKINYTLQEIVTQADKRAHFAKRYNGDAAKYGSRLLSLYKASKKK